MVAFGEFTFQELVTNQLFGLEFCAVQQDTFDPRQDFEQVNFYKNRVFISLVGPSDNWRKPTYLQLAENWNIPTKV